MHTGPAEITTDVPPPPLSRVAPAWGGGEAVRSARGRSRRSLWIVALVVLLGGLVVFFAGRAYLRAKSRANDLAGQLHARMNQKDWGGIYDNADAVYRAKMTSADSEALFAAINRKLGAVSQSSQQTTNLVVNNSGSYVTAQFETQFAGDPHATETIVWRSLGGAYHLHAYTIESLPLLTK